MTGRQSWAIANPALTEADERRGEFCRINQERGIASFVFVKVEEEPFGGEPFWQASVLAFNRKRTKLARVELWNPGTRRAAEAILGKLLEGVGDGEPVRVNRDRDLSVLVRLSEREKVLLEKYGSEETVEGE